MAAFRKMISFANCWLIWRNWKWNVPEIQSWAHWVLDFWLDWTQVPDTRRKRLNVSNRSDFIRRNLEKSWRFGESTSNRSYIRAEFSEPWHVYDEDEIMGESCRSIHRLVQSKRQLETTCHTWNYNSFLVFLFGTTMTFFRFCFFFCRASYALGIRWIKLNNKNYRIMLLAPFIIQLLYQPIHLCGLFSISNYFRLASTIS